MIELIELRLDELALMNRSAEILNCSDCEMQIIVDDVLCIFLQGWN